MTDPDTVFELPERAISVRLDERAQEALDALVASGLSQSEALRRALIESAQRLQSQSLADEARRLAEDPDDRAEAAAILAFMEELRPAWPSE